MNGRENMMAGEGMGGGEIPSRDSELGTALGSLTEGPSETGELWRRALDVHEKTRSRRVWRLRGAGVAIAACLCVVGGIGISLMRSVETRPVLGIAIDKAVPPTSAPAAPGAYRMAESEGRVRAPVYKQAGGDAALGAKPGNMSFGTTAQFQKEGPESADRQIVRKSQMDLRVASVRSAYAKVGLLLSEASGEHVEQASIGGQDAAQTATLTLRVSSARLPALLDGLRGLGTVVTESSTGEDVTDQAIDLEARLRNERRIEAELLSLMERKQDSTLEDIMKLRDRLADVREKIERLVAQGDRLSKLVSLATVVVTLSPEAAPPPVEKAQGFLDYTRERFEQGWERGTRSLANCAAWIVEVAVGGLIVWIVLGVLAIFSIAVFRALWRRGSREPAPVLSDGQGRG